MLSRPRPEMTCFDLGAAVARDQVPQQRDVAFGARREVGVAAF